MNTRTFQNIIPRISFAWWETLFMRAGFAWLLFSHFPTLSSLPPAGSELPFPTGLQRWLDLSWALEPGAYAILWIIMSAAAALYVTGFAFPIAASLLFFCYLVCGTLQNSLGSTSHYYQLMTLMLLSQALAAWLWTSLGRSNVANGLLKSPGELHSFTTRVTLQIVTGNYVLCALTKLMISKGAWFWNSQYMPLDFVKIEQQQYHNTLQYPDMGLGGTVNEFSLQHPWMCLFLYSPGLLVELFAFLILFGRGWAFGFGIIVVAMHGMIKITMGLDFPQHQWIIFLFAVNLPYWVWWLWNKRHRSPILAK